MNTKQKKPGQPRPAVLAAAVALALAAPAHAAGELDALKQELEQQRRMLEQQQKLIERLEQKLATTAAPAVSAGPAPKASDGKPLVTIYGILDSGVEHITNVGADGKSLTRVPPITATLPSRLGFRLHKEFRPGYAAVGTLEAGFNLDDGNQLQAGRIFGRQAFAGLETPYGTFSFGRQYSMLIGAMMGSDQLGPNIYGLSSLDIYLPNSRYDNSLAWKHRIGGFSAGVSYSFGRDTSGGAPASGTCAGEQASISDTQQCKAWSAMLRYDAPGFGLAGGIDQLKGGSGATAFFFNGAAPFAFADSGDKDTRTTVGGYLKFAGAQIGLGWLGRKVDTAATDVESDTYYLTASYQLSAAMKLDGGVYRIVNDDQDRDATLSVLRLFFSLDKGLDAYAQLGHVANSDQASYALSGAGGATAPAAGKSQNGYMLGLRYFF